MAIARVFDVLLVGAVACSSRASHDEDAAGGAPGDAGALGESGEASGGAEEAAGGTGTSGGGRADAGAGSDTGGAGSGGAGSATGGGSGGPGPGECNVQIEPAPIPDFPGWEPREDECSLCYHETCEYRVFTCGSFLDPCGTERECGPPPVRLGQEANCPADKPTLWACSEATRATDKIPLPDASCEARGDLACCPSSLTEASAVQIGGPGPPISVQPDTDCDELQPFYLDQDSDDYGGPISVLACFAPNSISEGPYEGVWVETPGDCFDSNSLVHPEPTMITTNSYQPPWLPVPIYDYDCNGVEQGNGPANTPCVMTTGPDNMPTCTGGGFQIETNRAASGVPGINDSCSTTVSFSCYYDRDDGCRTQAFFGTLNACR